MKTAAQTTFPERAGRAFGRMWRGFARRERQAAGWLVARGVPAGAATALLWAVKLVVLGVLLYAAFWVALLLAFVVVAAWLASNANDAVADQPQPMMDDDERDHRKSVFYHPLSYSDDPDPRFEDD